ncbi:hypothetical protein CH063_04058, partial [Colletotrichum higginsianum]
ALGPTSTRARTLNGFRFRLSSRLQLFVPPPVRHLDQADLGLLQPQRGLVSLLDEPLQVARIAGDPNILDGVAEEFPKASGILVLWWDAIEHDCPR